MNPSSRYLCYFGSSAATLLAAIAFSNWWLDPLQHYHPAEHAPLAWAPSRYRLPGIARHTKAEMVIAGTSVSKHLRPSDAEMIFGTEAINVAMDGASAHEQFLLLRLALRTGAVREVVWDVNYEYLRGSAQWVSDYDGAFPAYLYDDTFWNDIPGYLLNLDTCKSSARLLAWRLGMGAGPISSPEDFLPTDLKFGTTAVRAAMERRQRGAAAFRALLPDFDPQKLRVSFAANYLALIQEFPQVRFHLFFPPFSAAYFEFLHTAAPELIPVFLQYRRDVFAAVQSVTNVQLHDPQSDRTVVEDLSRYSDPIHFDAATHTLLLQGIRDARWKAAPQRLDALATWVENLRPNAP